MISYLCGFKINKIKKKKKKKTRRKPPVKGPLLVLVCFLLQEDVPPGYWVTASSATLVKETTNWKERVKCCGRDSLGQNVVE